MQIGLDASVLIGLLDTQDIWHGPATALEHTLKANRAEIAVFDCALAEAVSVIARRVCERRRRADLGQIIHSIVNSYPPGNILWILPDVPHMYTEILELVHSSNGELNFNDALIALSCQRRGIPYLASFDRDFDQIAWLQRIAKPDDLD